MCYACEDVAEFSISSVRSKTHSQTSVSASKNEWARSREEMEFDIQNLLSGGGMAQVGHGTSVNYTCICMSSGPLIIDTWPFLLLCQKQPCPDYIVSQIPQAKEIK